MSKNIRFGGGRITKEHRGWLDKVKREQLRMTDTDAIVWLLWCYVNRWVNPPAAGSAKRRARRKER